MRSSSGCVAAASGTAAQGRVPRRLLGAPHFAEVGRAWRVRSHLGEAHRGVRGTRRSGLRVAGRRWGHGQGTLWGDLVGPNPTDRAKNGLKRSLLVEADGGPLSVVIAGANVPDFKLLEATLDAPSWSDGPLPTNKRLVMSTCAWTRATTKRQRGRSSNRGATSLTSARSARRNSMMRV